MVQLPLREEGEVMPNDQEISRNLRVVENAIAQQRLEGLEPSGALVADLERVARGEISVHDVIENINKRFTHAEVRKPRSLSRS